jgi:hypothetical protein
MNRCMTAWTQLRDRIHILLLCGMSCRWTKRQVTVLLFAAIAVTIAIPCALAMTWYPRYPEHAASVRVRLPNYTLIIERSGSWLFRVTRALRSEQGEPDADQIPEPLAGSLQSETRVRSFKEFLSPVVKTISRTTSPLPYYAQPSSDAPYVLIAEYGWPFTTVSCHVTGTYADCGVRRGQLHDAICISPVQQLIPTYYGHGPWRVSAGFYMADVPYQNLPTRVSVAGAFGNVVVLFCSMVGVRLVWRTTKSVWRTRRGCCRVCGYDLGGIRSRQCPECGSPTQGMNTTPATPASIL